jgi:Tfp pilus assembly protein PilF
MRWHVVGWVLVGAYMMTIVGNQFLTKSLAVPVRGRWSQFLTQSEAFGYYVKLLIWPLGLNVEHQFFAQEQVTLPVLLSLLFLGAFLLAIFWAYKRRWDLPLFLNLWALLVMAPVVVMPLNVLVNERRLYLPCAAFCIGLALMLNSRPLKSKWGGVEIGRVLSLVLVLGYGGLVIERNTVWKSELSLWSDAVVKAPLMPRIHLYLGNAHKDAAFASISEEQALAHWQEARVAYRRAIELDPQNDLALRALNNLGAVSFVLKDIEAAEKAYRRAVELNPKYADALVNLGTIYHEKARLNPNPVESEPQLRESISYYRKALRLLPNHSDAWANLGLAFFELDQLDSALKAYERAYYLNAGNFRLLNNMGNYYATLGQREIERGESGQANLHKARRYFQQALRLSPGYDAPRRGLEIVDQLLDR